MLDISWVNRRMEATILIMNARNYSIEGKWETYESQQRAKEDTERQLYRCQLSAHLHIIKRVGMSASNNFSNSGDDCDSVFIHNSLLCLTRDSGPSKDHTTAKPDLAGRQLLPKGA